MKQTGAALKLNLYYILSLGLPYSVILIFSAYGPALHFISGPERNLRFSSIFLFILLTSMIIPSKKLLTERLRRNLLHTSIILAAGLLAFFTRLPEWLQISSLLLLGLIEGRIAQSWSRQFNKTAGKTDRIFILTSALFIAYALLYLANISYPSIPVNLIPLTCSVILAAAVPFLILISSDKSINKTIEPAAISDAEQNFPIKNRITIYLIIFIIYLTAGFTYTIIFPEMKTYGILDRYYNVLPFVLIMPAAGLILHKTGPKNLLSIGIALLGVSYIFHQFPTKTSTYFLVDSFIQPGWAFLDLFVWVIGSYLAKKTGKSRYIPFCVAVFLAGTVAGAILSIFFLKLELHNYRTIIFLTLSLLPLFLAVPMLNRIELSSNLGNTEPDPVLPDNILTAREYQIARLLLLNKTQKEICTDIHISINTLKTHTRNIYRKLGVKNKQELRRFKA